MNNNFNIIWHEHDVNKAAHSSQKYQTPCVIWFAALSGSGKSTIAGATDMKLFASGQYTYLLNGDNVRHGFNNDLGFSNSDRVESIRRIGEMSKLFVGAVMIAHSIFISPFKIERNKKLVKVLMDTSLAISVDRHPDGYYKKASASDIKTLSGIDSEYEIVGKSEVTIDTVIMSVKKWVIAIITFLQISECLPTKQLTKAKGWV